MCFVDSRTNIRRVGRRVRASVFTLSSQRQTTSSLPKLFVKYKVRYVHLVTAWPDALKTCCHRPSKCGESDCVFFSRTNIKNQGGETCPAVCTRSCRRRWTLCTLKRLQSCRVRCVQVQRDAFRFRPASCRTSFSLDLDGEMLLPLSVWSLGERGIV